MGIKTRRTSSKNPPILSHEFMIQNHADIVSCMAMVFVIGLMFQVTSPVASMFIALHHNISSIEPTEHQDVVYYTYGMRDISLVFFYFLICIVMHALIQEYLLDKVNRKMHLSKIKHSKFNESGQLLIFYLLSVFWGGNIIVRENLLLDISSLWDNYPHSQMNFMFKFFYVVQLSYWLHCFPELYFQKVKKEEWMGRISYSFLSFIFLLVAYIFNFTRVAICLVVLHYSVESVFHASRLLYFADKGEAAKKGYMIGNILFVNVRLGSIILAVLTFWYGLALSEEQGFDVVTGNFNTPVIRINVLIAICLLQAWMMWNFITFHLQRMRERAALQAAATKKKNADKKEKKSKREEHKRGSEEDVSELPEVDQNTKKSFRSRITASQRK